MVGIRIAVPLFDYAKADQLPVLADLIAEAAFAVRPSFPEL